MTELKSNAEAEFRLKLLKAYSTSPGDNCTAEELDVEITPEDVLDMERKTVQLRNRMAEAMNMTELKSNAEAEFRLKLLKAYSTSPGDNCTAEELDVEITAEDVVDMERETVQLRNRMA